MIIATAGHVDHGKTELVKALTGIDTDRLPEEKARGLSVDLGFAYHRLSDSKTLGFVDVPGHEKFIRNMLAGVAGIDLALLVVAVDDGVMPQTREHIAILGLMGIRQCIVALTKIDRVPIDRVQEVSDQVEKLLSKTGYDSVSIFPVCAPENIGIKPLMEALEARTKAVSNRTKEQHFRLAVDRVFTLKGVGLVVTGMVFSGTATIGEHLTLSANGLQVRIRGIRANNIEVDRADAGERCAINIAGRGLSEQSIKRGDWLIHSSLNVPTRRIDVELQVLDTEAGPLKHWTPTHLHIGADHVSARVAVLSGGSIPAGGRGLVQLVTSRDVFTVHDDHFVLRDQSALRTIAGGRVINPFSPKRGRARPERIAALNAQRHRCAADVLKALTKESETGILPAPFAVAYNLPGPRIDKLVESLELLRIGQQPNQRIFCKLQWLALKAKIMKAVGDFHISKPMLYGVSVKDIQLALKPYIDTATLKEAIGTLVNESQLTIQGNRFHLPSHKTEISKHDRQLLERVTPELAPQSGTPLSLHKAAEKLCIETNMLEKVLKTACKHGDMVLIGENRYVPKSYIKKLGIVAERLAITTTDRLFTTAEYRDQTELGRNFTIDILEYFDQLGLTERIGNARRIRRSAADIFAVTDDG